ncbi:double-strand break repair protein AddB [Sphingomonas flavalba]|uniref:double-strand break repair protein AddB n=1 Tax=Sphingomonas flavalba TaxID=2559804 RepID=UPI0039E1F0F4
MSPAVFTIPPHRAFADALAAGLLARFPERLAMARGVVLLPTNRAVRAVTDAFVRRAGGGLLLPRLVPVGDPELDEHLGSALDPIGAEPLPPAIAPMARRMRLARLVQAERRRAGQPVDAAEALRLADELGRTLDQLHVERVAPHRLRDLPVAAELSAHWQLSLDQLRVILDLWPRELVEAGRIDLADRRNRLLDRVAARWAAEGVAGGFVVAAGIATSAPAVAGLLRVVARMPGGMVVFAGLDQTMAEADWQAIGPHQPDPVTGLSPRPIETHPQFHLKLLLERMGINRAEVERWRWGGGHDAPAARSRAISNALAPPDSTAGWAALDADQRSLAGVTALELATPAEEAQAIAIALRRAVEEPGRTAALVTPDRALATRVSAHLRRWGIAADDSAGQPLSALPPGTLLTALAEAAAEDFAPVALLTLLKHPLVRQGAERLAWLDAIRLIDRALRGPRPPPGLDGITAFLAAGDRRERRHRAPAEVVWRDIRPLLEPLAAARGAGTLAALIAALREAATALAGDAAWARPSGRAAAELVAELEAHADSGPADARIDGLPALIRQLADSVAVRPPQGGHPRIFIWGLIEARLQQADLMVLGGLNEGTWPALAAPDPWLAPRIRRALDLPGLERRIGLAAHDFASALGAPRVLITRARRDASAPAVASRLWLRLEAMSGGMARDTALAALAHAIDEPGEHRPAGRPAPAPPSAARPRKIAVTDVDRLKADPFAFYARAVLRLAPLDPIDADPTAAWRGTAVHAVLEGWAKKDGWDPARLRPRAEAMLRRADAHPMLRALWAPRLLEAIDWIAAQLAAGLAEGRRPLIAEQWGQADVAGVTLGGRADRIDRLADGGLVIVDYKTGMPPSAKQVAAGYAQQLGLLGLIAERGGFGEIEGTAAGFEYWSLARGRDGGFGHVASPVDPAGARDRIVTADFTRHAADIFAAAAERWLTGDAPFVAKLSPEHAPYTDYDQLMRLDEWYGRDG